MANGKRTTKKPLTESEVRRRKQAMEVKDAVAELERELGFRPKFAHVAGKLQTSVSTAARRIWVAEEMGLVEMDASRRGTLTVAEEWR
jgi:hypothetical protein